MENRKHKKTFVFIAAVGIALLTAILISPPRVSASVIGDFLRGLFGPLLTPPAPNPPATPGAETPATKEETKPHIPLYKPVIEYERSVIEAVKRASPAVVSLTVSKNVPIIERCPVNPFPDLPPEFREFFGERFPQFYAPCEKGTRLEKVGGGSGFIVSSDGLIVTNRHVVADTVASYTVFTNDGKKYDAEVVARDPSRDLAIIKIKASGLPTLTLGDSDTLELGQTVIAIGNALAEFRNTVSVGVVSGLSRTVTAKGDGGVETIRGVIQTDAAINPGNSGGPLLNLRGEVVGINTAVAIGAENIGFAIPINRAKRAISSVKSTGEIQTPYLGVRYMIVTPELTAREKLPVDYGALLRGSEDGPAVAPGSPAAAAGLQAEDIILEFNGKRITKDAPLADMISDRAVGEVVSLRVRRGDRVFTVSITLAKRQ